MLKYFIGLMLIFAGALCSVFSFDYDAVNDRYDYTEWHAWMSEMKKGTDLISLEVPFRAASHWQSSDAPYVDYIGEIDGVRFNLVRDRLIGIDRTNYDYLNGYYSYIINIEDYRTNKIVATGYVIKAAAHPNPWQRIIIMADGFDPFNSRTFRHLLVDPKFKNLLNPLPIGNHVTPLFLGYDICFVDFVDGAGDIRYNAKAMLCLIEKINDEVVKVGGSEVIVGGFSMGGLISRLALLYAQQDAWENGNLVYAGYVPRVTKYIAVDSPQKGACIPIEIQQLILNYKSNTLVGAPLEENWKQLNQTAAIQMCYSHVSAFNSNTNSYADEHDKFFQFLKDLGDFPTELPRLRERISLSVSDWSIPYPSATSGQVVLRFSIGDDPNSPTLVHFYNHELAPGSYINMLQPFSATAISNMVFSYSIPQIDWTKEVGIILTRPNSVDQYFKPTFMPIYSVFALKDNTPAELQNKDNLL